MKKSLNYVNYVKMMKDFHKTFDVPVGKTPKIITSEDFIRRLTLIMSEVGELGDAVRKQDLIEIADALGDILYVTFGMAVEMGLDINKIYTQIHASNMSKANNDGSVTKDAGGKVLKSKNYKPIDLSWILKETRPVCFGTGYFNPNVSPALCQICEYEKECEEECDENL